MITIRPSRPLSLLNLGAPRPALALRGSSERNNQNEEVSCFYDLESQENKLSYKGKVFSTVRSFFESISKKNEIDANTAAKVLNYWVNGENFHVIDNPQNFELSRNRQCEQFLEKPWDCPQSICDKYDISEIKPPQIKNDQIIFYVESEYIPFKLSCQWPLKCDHPCIKREILSPVT